MASAQPSFFPEWTPPDRETVNQVDPGNMLRQFQSYHHGLSEVQIEPILRHPKEARPVGIVQRFVMETEPGARPSVTAKHLAQLARVWVQDYVDERKIKIVFRIWLVGKDAKDMPFRKYTQATIHPACVSEPEDEDEDEEGEGEDEDDEEGEDEDEEGEDDEDDDEDEDDEEEEEEEEDVPMDSPRRPTTSSAQEPFAFDHVSAIENPLVESPMNRPVPTTARDPRDPRDTAVATVHEPAPAPAALMMINPATLVSMQKVGLDFAKSVYAEVRADDRLMLKENREMMKAVQDLCKDLVTSVKTAVVDVMGKVAEAQEKQQNFFIKEREKQNERIEKLETQLIKSVELSGNLYKNLQEIAKQGWQAFVDGMELQRGALRNDQAWQQAFFGQELGFARAEQRVEKTGSWVAQALPVGLVLGAGFLRKRGDSETASMLEFLAKRFAPAEPDDEGIDEEDEDVVDADAREAGPTNGSPPNGHAAGGQAPFGSRSGGGMAAKCHAWRATLSTEQLRKIKSAVTQRAWQAFEEATKAASDHIAIANMTLLGRMLDADKALAFRLIELLEESQIDALESLRNDLKKYAGPQRPRPST